MHRPINFCSGPAALPEAVLDQMQTDLLNFSGSGISVMEHYHRDLRIIELFDQTESRLLKLMGLDEGYRAVFVPGGATLQFAQIPMNYLDESQSAGFLTTGAWSQKAVKEASRFGKIKEVASSADSLFTTIPAVDDWQISDNLAYIHLCTNETIHGVEWFGNAPDIGVPIVADMSSHLLSRPIDHHNYSIIYAGAQKNLGTAGVCVLVLKTDFERCMHPRTPSLLQIDKQLEQRSMVNTPPVHAVWVLSLILEWIEAEGGVSVMGKKNREKAAALYSCLDASDLFSNPVDPACRSLMNVPFVLADERLDQRFLDQAASNNLLNLKGHRSVGGMRASIYNAISKREVDTLIEFLREFERAA